ncbi:alpha-mannosidase At3g26720-like [Macadamia integrifolia]|uniref:alpha-mannosidase At3g26720-like n=1 Tax=Macadamia integrifolia TaxID=60698 RepID=UPI001C530F5C|nr:alpha-mannosidase At3g26720-like [Macadamia integrifolia]
MAIGLLFLAFFSAVLCVESRYIAYNTSQGIVPGKINVHMVPHTHDDVGWLKTIDQYYVGSNNSIQGACVQNVLDSVIQALLADKNRKFIYVEIAFFQRWWRDQSESVKSAVKQLVSSGQLEFINGGMCMHDEAASHYIDMIDQTTIGHRFIKQKFGVTPRIGWQIDPFGHSAVQAYLLGAEVGFDSLFFARIDYQDRAKRKNEKSLEFVWWGSKTLGSSAQIFSGAFPEHYEPPRGFYFEVNDDSPIVQDDISLFDYNVEERVNDFVAAAVSQANVTRTNHIMWTMGTDFKYQYAHTWFRNMDKLIHYVNKDGRVNALYSTPSIYTDAKHATNESWPIKTNDFFPYADRANAYWTGYFTSRPSLKRYVRFLSGYHLAARQLEFFKGRNNLRPNTDNLADALAVAQHHDAVSGTEKQHVANDYAKRLSIGYAEAEAMVGSSLAYLIESSDIGGRNSMTNFEQCALLNISYCPPSEMDFSHGKSLVVVVYNSLGWKREDVVRIPVSLFSALCHIVTSVCSSSAIASMSLTSAGSENGTIEVGQGNLKLIYSTDEGKLTQYINSRSLVEASLHQSYSFYAGSNGTDKDPQASGAYVFRPNGTFPISSEGQDTLTVLRGPILDEVHQRINPWIYQVTRVYKAKEHAEVEFSIGPIPVDDGIGKEIITQIATTMDTNKTFYTDSNGRDFIERIRDYRTDWDLQVNQPIAGNYYPVCFPYTYNYDICSMFYVIICLSTTIRALNLSW